VFVLFKARIPGIAITEEDAVYVVSLIASWILGDSIRGVTDTLWKSKRFIAALGGVAFVLLKARLPGITEEQTMYIVGLISSWILGDSVRAIPKPADPVQKV
jgi:hypothetical protein